MNGRAPHHAGGRFRNPWPDSRPGSVAALPAWMFERLSRRVRGTLPADPPEGSFEVLAPHLVRPRAEADACRVTWLGHSTCLLQVGGLNLLTDPVWAERASPVAWAGPRRRVRAPLALADLPPLDVVLISHDHYDHFDTRAIRALAALHPEARWYAPLGLGSGVRALGPRAVTELDWWAGAAFGDGAARVTVTATPAQHFSGRTPFDRDATLWCGWVVEVAADRAARRVFFAGDTGLHPEFARIGRALGPFDVTLMPIGAYAPRWFMRPVHMDPDEAAQAWAACTGGRPAACVPIHWGTYKLTDEPLDEPPRLLADAWRRRGLPASALRVLRHGETLIVPAG